MALKWKIWCKDPSITLYKLMPYKVVQFENGKYKVTKNQAGKPIYFSNKFLTKDQALAQLKALYYHESK